MAFLDVSDLLIDPDLATTFDVQRTTETVGSNGRASQSVMITAGVVGVVVPDKTSLVRNPDGSRLSGSIQIYTQFRLTDGSGNVSADVIVWNGRNYTVMAVSDFSQYGAGFIHAAADLVSVNP